MVVSEGLSRKSLQLVMTSATTVNNMKKYFFMIVEF